MLEYLWTPSTRQSGQVYRITRWIIFGHPVQVSQAEYIELHAGLFVHNHFSVIPHNL